MQPTRRPTTVPYRPRASRSTGEQLGSFLGDALNNQTEVTTPTDSKRGQGLLSRRIGGGSEPGEVVVVRSGTLTADDPAFKDQIRRLLQGALAATVLDAEAVATATVEDPPVSPDRDAVLVALPMRTDDVEAGGAGQPAWAGALGQGCR